ncbi:MAG: hypothetical protein GY778_26110 [bacterium]|nr:hypothetical protein [bacterium]
MNTENAGPESANRVLPDRGTAPLPGGDPAADTTADVSDESRGSGQSYSIYHFIHAPEPELDDCLDGFWEATRPLDELPPIPPLPDEPCEILKRLGPSPFRGSSFPLIGFFATAYDRVSRFARERTER